MIEVDLLLFKITYNVTDGAVDFTVPAVNDDLVRQHRPEIIRMMEKLMNALRDNTYPFRLDREGAWTPRPDFGEGMFAHHDGGLMNLRTRKCSLCGEVKPEGEG